MCAAPHRLNGISAISKASLVQPAADLVLQAQDENTIFVRVFIPEQNLQVSGTMLWAPSRGPVLSTAFLPVLLNRYVYVSIQMLIHMLQKCLLFERNATVWKAKQLVLQKLAVVIFISMHLPTLTSHFFLVYPDYCILTSSLL